MEERTSYLVVGVFVLTAVAVTLGFTVWISGGRGADAMTNYTLMFDRDVSGLTLGSPVRYLGVDVGEVTARGQTRSIQLFSIDRFHPRQNISE